MNTRQLQKMIHVGCRQLGIDRETRHDLQLVATGKTSMSDMTEADLHKVVAALKQRGFKAYGNSHFKARKGAGQKAGRPAAPRADLRLVHVLWRLLGEAGALRDPSRTGLNKFIRVRFEGTWKSVPIDVDTLRDHTQISQIINALKDWCAREGVELNR